MQKRLVFLVALILLAPMAARMSSAQQGESRVALLIGNAAYPDAESPLKEPVSDAKAMAEELRRQGFEVDVGENLSKEAMQRALERLYGKVTFGSTALIFFSGYGIQSNRQSYMIPVNAKIWSELDVRRDGFSLDAVLAQMNVKGARVKIAILDASRRNPFERRFRSYSQGLAPITAPKGTLVMCSATPGTVADDATPGLFVAELLKEMRKPGLTVEEVFNRTRMDVVRASKEQQVPWFSSSLGEEFAFSGRAQAKLESKA